MNKIRNHPYLLTGSLFSLFIGFILLFVNPLSILRFIYFVLGVSLIGTGISKIIIFSKMKHEEFPIEAIINIIIGASIMLFHNLIITIILGALFMVFPIIRIFKAYNKRLAFKKEFPMLLIGLVIAISGNFIFGILIKILGGVFVLLAVYLFLLIFFNKISIFTEERPTKRVIRDDVIDATFEERD